jgi:hypothetical protein
MREVAKTRPVQVTLIALYHFIGASIILLFALGSWLYPGLHISSSLLVQVIVYVITRHNIATPMMVPIMLPFFAAYLAAIGWGLWHLMKWARNLVLATSGLTVVIWIRALLVREWALGQSLFKNELAQDTVFVVILINVIILCCLTIYPDVVRVFDQENE